MCPQFGCVTGTTHNGIQGNNTSKRCSLHFQGGLVIIECTGLTFHTGYALGNLRRMSQLPDQLLDSTEILGAGGFINV